MKFLLIAAAILLNSACIPRVAVEQSASAEPSITKAISKERAYEIFVQAMTFEEFGNVDAAFAGYEEVLRLDPEATVLRNKLLNYYLERNLIDKALSIVQLMFNEDTSSVLNGQLYARLLFKSGKPSDAYSIIKRIKKFANVNDYALIEFEGLLAEEVRDTLSALSAWKKLAAFPETKAVAQDRMLSLYLDCDSINQAISQVAIIIKDLRYSQSTRLSLLRLADKTGNSDTVIAMLNVLKKGAASETAKQAQGDIAYLLLKSGKTDDAEMEYRDLAAKGDASDRKSLALFLFARSKLAEAESILVSADKEQPDAYTQMYIGRIRLGLSKYDSAAVSFSRYLSDPKNLNEALYYLGMTFEMQKKYDSSIVYFSRLYALDTSNADCLFRLAASHERKGNFETAEKMMVNVIKMAPLFHTAQNYLAYMYADKGIKLDTAEILVKNALSLDSANSAYLDTYGWVLYKKGFENEKSLELLERALALSDGSDIEIFEHLAAVSKALGRMDKHEDYINRLSGMKKKVQNEH
ncbi:MAG: tetratricopeptide repeat protein [Fibrobacteres bacterium]|nr:tetratricopeptide repeat protein [Fibrobacterota bacterium]